MPTKPTIETSPLQSAKNACAIAADELARARREYDDANRTLAILNNEIESTTDIEEMADQIRRLEIKRDLAQKKVILARRKESSSRLELYEIEAAELKCQITEAKKRRNEIIVGLAAVLRKDFDKPEQVAEQSRAVAEIDRELECLRAAYNRANLALSSARADSIQHQPKGA